MVGSLHGDDVLLLGGETGDLDGGLDGLGPRVPKEEAVEGRVGHDGQEALDELQVGRRECDGALEVDESLGLTLDGGGHGGVAASCKRCDPVGRSREYLLAKVGDTDTRGKVEKLATFAGPEVGALSLDSDDVLETAKTMGDVLPSKLGPLGLGAYWSWHVGIVVVLVVERLRGKCGLCQCARRRSGDGAR